MRTLRGIACEQGSLATNTMLRALCGAHAPHSGCAPRRADRDHAHVTRHAGGTALARGSARRLAAARAAQVDAPPAAAALDQAAPYRVTGAAPARTRTPPPRADGIRIRHHALRPRPFLQAARLRGGAPLTCPSPTPLALPKRTPCPPDDSRDSGRCAVAVPVAAVRVRLRDRTRLGTCRRGAAAAARSPACDRVAGR